MGHRSPYLLLLASVLCLSLGEPCLAQNSGTSMSNADLDTLVAPIALYPDALVAQILPASTYPIQIVEASRDTANGAKPDAKTMSQWDPSIQALVSVPSVLKMMDDKISWTTQLGQAVSQDQKSVMAAIQRVRAEAQKAGNLETNQQQVITTQGDTIIIQPANPQVIYVPQYDPAAILYPAPPSASYGLMTFGLGFAAGALTAYACDWGDHWGGGTVVVNRNYNYVNVHNTNINNYDRSSYTSWKAPTNVGRITKDPATYRPTSYDRSGVPSYSLNGDDHPGADTNTARDDAAARESLGNDAERGGDALNARTDARSGNAFAGVDGGGWQARAASDRGAQSFGGFHGAGGFRGGRR